MKILFINRSTAHFYYTKSILEALLARGHKVDVLFEKTKEHWIKGEYTKPIDEFKKKYPDFTYGQSFPRSDAWRPIVMPARVLLNYRRFLFADNQSDYFKERNIKYLPGLLKFFLKVPGINSVIKTEMFSKALYKLEDMAGMDAKILQQVKNYSPDVVFVTLGGMRYGSMDSDYLKAAKALGIKTAVLALSWDSVSNKAYLQIKPDVFLLWNDVHKEQAREHHAVPGEKIKIVGAPVFDGWFSDFKPALTRTEFCKKYGFNTKNPIILYLGSPSTITADEQWLVKETRDALNASDDARLKNTQIIFRPHPAHYKAYADMDIPGVVVAPKGGEMVDTMDARQLFYDTLTHASAVVAVNTSGMIDSVIMDKPIIVLMRSQYSETQKDAEHFKAMMQEKPFSITESNGEFLGVLKNILDGKDDKKSARENFVRRFIRPQGLAVSAGERATFEIENLCKKN